MDRIIEILKDMEERSARINVVRAELDELRAEQDKDVERLKEECLGEPRSDM